MSDRFFPFLFHFVRMQRWTFLGIALLTVIRSWGQGYFPYFLKKLLDFISVSSPETLDTNSIFVLLMRLMLCWIIIEISMRFLSWLLMKGFPLLRVNIRKYTFSYLLGHSIDYFEQNLSGSLASKMNELPKHCEKILETFLVSILNTFFLTLFSAFAFYQIGLIYCLLIIGLFISHIGITLLGYKKIHLCNKLQSSTNAHVNGQFVDCLHNIKMIQGSNSEAFEIRRMEKHLKIEAHRYRQSLGSFEITNTARSCVSILFTALSFSFLIYDWFHHQVTLGDFSLVTVASFNLTNNLWIMNHQLIKLFMEAGGAHDALQTIMKEKKSSQVPPIKISKGAISIKHLSFAYPFAKLLFSDFSLEIPAGQKIGIVGQSGSGKSTLMQLLLGFYTPQKGSILIDDQDIEQTSLTSLRQQVNFIGQHFGLLHRSLLANLTYGTRGQNWDSLMTATERTECNQWIKQFHRGYLSIVGKECGNLSGGQIQSLFLTRVLLNSAPLIIIDEPTSALDETTEKKLIDEVVSFAQDKTLIIATHHLSSLSRMDRVIVFKEGSIINDGKPEEITKFSQNYSFT